MSLWLLFVMHSCVYAAEGTSLLLNTTVIYLALTETNKDLKEYKNLLVLNGIVDYTCTLIGIFNHDNLEITHNLWVHILGWPANLFPKEWHYIFVGAYSFKLSFGIQSLPIQFGYRWYLVCKKKILTAPKLCGIFVAAFIASCHWWTFFGLAFWVSDYKYTNHTFLKSNPFIFNNATPNPTLLIGELKCLPMLEIIISTAVVGNGIICYLIGYFTYKTICKLNELKAEMSERTRRLQNQMNRLLFTQTVSVFATALIPLLIMLFMMLTSIEIHGMGTFINMILSWIPVLNPICTLIFVHRFRVRILTVILPCARRRIVSTYGSTLTHFSKDATPMTIA